MISENFLYVLDAGDSSDGTLLLEFGVSTLDTFYDVFDTPLEEPETYAHVIGIIGYESASAAQTKLAEILTEFADAQNLNASHNYHETPQMSNFFKSTKDEFPYIKEACSRAGRQINDSLF